MSHETNDPGDNPYRPRTLAVGDPHHDAQLLRDVSIIHAQTVRRLGPLPHGGLPVQPKRKPNLPQHTPTSATYPTEDDPMKLHQLAAAAIVPLVVAAAGCSHGIDIANDDATGHLNQHPQKRYEVIATSHAPGPWDSLKGIAFFDVINKPCVPENSFTGGQAVPNTDIDISMTRVDDHTWKGYFYRDALQDEDYFGLGICHWDTTGVGIAAVAKGVRFNSSDMLVSLLRNGASTSYFKKSDYGDASKIRYGAADLTAEDPEVLQRPDAYFTVTISVKEAKL
jgi:hypothetical protein